ncbi:MAG: hypothetical protein RL328_2759 [Acidobacteriota bacterium]|jgi:pilus assembly protein CpaE
MIRLALISSPNSGGLPAGLLGASVFEVVATCSTRSPAGTIARTIAPLDPEVLLIDFSAVAEPEELIRELAQISRKAVLLGYGTRYSESQRAALEAAGLSGMLQDSFTPTDLDEAVRWAQHQAHPVLHPNIFAFLPAKAGSGCSTTVLNTAAHLANTLDKKTLLIEGDLRSGVVAFMLDLRNRGGLQAILEESGNLSPVHWQSHVETIGKLDLLMADPLHAGPLPTWATYFHILAFSHTMYDCILADLPEVVNPATSELVMAARLVFIVCEPELASLKLVQVRRKELEAAGVPADRICVLGNRWESKRLTKEALEAETRTPMYAALPNDYLQVKNAVMESRLVAPTSKFGQACATLARRISGARQEAPSGPVASLLRRFAGD